MKNLERMSERKKGVNDVDVVCKPEHKSFDEIWGDIVVVVSGICMIMFIIYYYSYIVSETDVYLYIMGIFILTFVIFYYSWAQSYQCPTIIIGDGIYVSREKTKKKYRKIYRKGYFITWQDITKMTLSNDKNSGWKCVFITKYGDKIEISSSSGYPEKCLPKLINLGKKLRDMNIKIVMSEKLLNYEDAETKDMGSN
jgi:hypothetical protein